MAHAPHACVARLHELFAAQRLREVRSARRAPQAPRSAVLRTARSSLCSAALTRFARAKAKDNDDSFWRAYCAEFYEPHAAVALCCCAYVSGEGDKRDAPPALLGAPLHPARACSLCAAAPFVGLGASRRRSRARRGRRRRAPAFRL